MRRKKQNGKFIDFPCGQCGNCRQSIKTEWLSRLTLEWKDAITAYFVTLTYNADTLPFDSKGQPSLDYDDIDKFNMRMRNYIRRKVKNKLPEDREYKYFIVGEYGTKTFRPHYHGILFNVPQEAIDKLPRIWKAGHITASRLDSESAIKYTCKYAFKDAFQTDREVPCKSRKSNSLGLARALRYPQNEHQGLYDMGEYKFPLPKAWIKHFYSEDQWKGIQRMNHIRQQNEYYELANELEEQGYQNGLDGIRELQILKSKDRMRNANRNKRL